VIIVGAQLPFGALVNMPYKPAARAESASVAKWGNEKGKYFAGQKRPHKEYPLHFDVVFDSIYFRVVETRSFVKFVTWAACSDPNGSLRHPFLLLTSKYLSFIAINSSMVFGMNTLLQHALPSICHNGPVLQLAMSGDRRGED
jgi:hypothetical protein